MRYIESEAVELKEKFTDVICKDIDSSGIPVGEKCHFSQ